MSLKKGKSVIVIPKTTGIFFEDKSFWKNLVLKLKEAGFDVYTSLDNCNNLSMIEGSKPIIFSLLEAIAVSEYAGHVVSIRSGLCDLISSSKCSIHVLYPEKTTYKFFLKGFSLKEYFTRKLYEYEIDSGNSYKVIEEIVKNMIKGDRKSKIP